MSTLPLFPLGLVLFPDGPLPLRIFEPRYVDLVKRCLKGTEPFFGVVLLREGREVGPHELAIEQVGTSAEITDFHQLRDGLLGLSCLGRRRFRIRARHQQPDGLHVAEVEWIEAEPVMPVPERHAPLVELLKAVLPEIGGPYAKLPTRLDEAAWVGHRLAEIMPISLDDKQIYLELSDPVERLDGIAELAPRVARA
jgi:Lon protease-like protein